jgi:hypothetical protein
MKLTLLVWGIMVVSVSALTRSPMTMRVGIRDLKTRSKIKSVLQWVGPDTAATFLLGPKVEGMVKKLNWKVAKAMRRKNTARCANLHLPVPKGWGEHDARPQGRGGSTIPVRLESASGSAASRG